MCSSGDTTAKNLEASQAAFSNTLNNDYATSFAEQQSVLNGLNAKLNYQISNPMGYSPSQLAQQTTSINDTTATAAKQAIGSAAAIAASHGGADTGSGAIGQIAGGIGSAAAQSKAQQLASLSQQNENLKQSNYWKGIQGLEGVGSEYGGGAGTAISGATNTANSATNAGDLALQSEQAGWEDLGGVMSGLGGLATAGTGFVEANPNGIFGK